jgi:methylated-DNA-[protein]-cysteine S-methyltransferase
MSKRGAIEEIAIASLRTRMGSVWILSTERGLRGIRIGADPRPSREEARARGARFIRRARWTDRARSELARYFEGRRVALDLPLDLAEGTEFEREVWSAARQVPHGTVASYAEVARGVGSPRATRAVGNALGKNPVPIVVPCHRILHADLSIGGFSSGLPWKRFLLELERGQLALEWRPKRRLSLFGRDD